MQQEDIMNLKVASFILLTIISLYSCSKSPDMKDGTFIGDIDKLVYNIQKRIIKTATIREIKNTGPGAKRINENKLTDYAKYVSKYTVVDPENSENTAPAEIHISILVFKDNDYATNYLKERYFYDDSHFKPYKGNNNVQVSVNDLKYGVSVLVFIEKNIIIELAVVEVYGDPLKKIYNFADKYPAWLKKRTSKNFINIHNKD